MKEIKKYMDIVRYGKASTIDVLNKGDYISITEKIDGANASFVLDEENANGVTCYSRKQTLSEDNTLRGFYGWVKENITPIKNKLNPSYRYIGEWLVPHKIQYKDECYHNFYLFSIWDDEKEEYLSDNIVQFEANKLGLKTVEYFYKGEFISYEHLLSFVGKSNITKELNEGEGIVVKNVDYRDKYGNQCFVKLVTEKFSEIQKQRPPKNPKEIDENTIKIKSVTTKARIDKILHKFIDEGLLTEEDLCIENMGNLIKMTCPRVLEDILKEEKEIIGDIEEKILNKNINRIVPPILREVLNEIGKII